MLNLRDCLWAGTDAALEYALEVERQILRIGQPAMAAQLKAAGFGREADAPPYQIASGVAIIPARGPLVNIDSDFLDFFGITTYPGLRRKFVAAAADAKVSQILFDVDSGGGAVSGVDDTATLIAQVNKLKPVTTFTGGTMASAALWLGASAQKIFATKTSMVGSIGVIAIHFDRSKQLEQDGIKPTVVRRGQFKALVNPVEPLTEKARAQMEAGMDTIYNVFVQHIADSRGVPFATADKKMGDGREFHGEEAQAVGLVDALTSFDKLLSGLQKKAVDKSRSVI